MPMIMVTPIIAVMLRSTPLSHNAMNTAVVENSKQPSTISASHSRRYRNINRMNSATSAAANTLLKPTKAICCCRYSPPSS